MSDAYSSTSYFYSSTTNTGDGGATTGHRYSTASTTDKDGNTIIRTARQDMGQGPVIEERRYDRTGQEELLPPTEVSSLPSTAEGMQQRITDLDEETTTYGYDSGMTLYALGSNDENIWDMIGDRLHPYESGSESMEYEDPITGAKVRRESDINVSTVL